MKRISWNGQLWLVGGGYLMVLGISGLLVVWRYLQYTWNRADVAASSGMWAGGDLMLELFILGMFLVVTFFLVLVIRNSEPAFTTYSKVLVGVSLTAPLSVAVIAIPAINRSEFILWQIVGYAALFRLFASPMMLFGMGASRLLARSARAKKLTVGALLIECLTLVGMVVVMFSGRAG